MWNPHEPLSARARQFLGVLGIASALLLWTGAHLLMERGSYFLPAPWQVARRVVLMLGAEGDGNLLVAAWASVRRVFLSVTLVVLLGVPLGVAMGASPRVNAVLSPVLDPLRSAPMVAVLPIVVLWFGIDEAAKVAFLFLGSGVFLVPMVRDAVVAVPRQHLVLAEDLGATPWESIRHSLLPLAMPRIVDAVIVAVGVAWTYITVAEYVNAETGLGRLIQVYKRASSNDGVFAGILTILVLALVTDQALKALKRWLYPWEAEA